MSTRKRQLGYALGLAGLLGLFTYTVLFSPRGGIRLDAQAQAVFGRAQRRWIQQMEIRPLRTHVTTVERYGVDQYLFIFAAYRPTGVVCGFVYARGAAPQMSGGGALAGGPGSGGDCTRAAETDPAVTHLRKLWSEEYGPPHVRGTSLTSPAP